jgi:hypothetical protein
VAEEPSGLKSQLWHGRQPQDGEGHMKYRTAILALILMSTPALADCVRPAYQEMKGARMTSVTLLPLSAVVTVLSIPTGIVGAATREPSLRRSTSDTVCFTAGLARHALVGRR